jgi:hypothetical protein
MAGGQPLSEKDQFDVARELIRHEDGLINNRVTWLLVLQGLLFNAFVGGVGLFFGKVPPRLAPAGLVVAGLTVIGVLGIVTNVITLNVIGIAFQQMARVQEWWTRTGLSEKFPPLSGRLGTGWFYFLFSAGRMPFALIAAWLLLVSFVFVGAFRCA